MHAMTFLRRLTRDSAEAPATQTPACRPRRPGRLRMAVWMLAWLGTLQPAFAAADEPSSARGKLIIERYACVACHRIPGVDGPPSDVGPPLSHIGERSYIAGVLPNTPDNMVRWLRDPPAVDSLTAMPNLGLSEAEARDIAAFLRTLK